VTTIQVSFAPLRTGRHAARLTVIASAVSSQASRGQSSFIAEVNLTAVGDVPAIQVIC